MIAVISYNRNHADTEVLEVYEDSAWQAANTRHLELDLRNANIPVEQMREVVILQAATLALMHTTHSKYFNNIL